jgi:hypothetical protein
LKNKLIKFSIISGALIISISVAYFFIFFLPNHLEKKKDFENDLKCQEAGWKLNKHYEKFYADTGATSSRPIFKFSKTLNTCLYEGGLTYEGGYMKFIDDINTNKRIVGSWCSVTNDGKNKCIIKGELVSDEEYQKKKKKLFGD